ncbi:3-hydroxyacyl-CoA dehydrogenase [Pseudomonas sp. CES]|uniref:3-hydroxyacyl-CoA dehydrogenase n=1 Tax=Pseudomonas sp. CES TaxID=2719586 RepID=UPI00146FFE11|nr:3-hydroxyacyl-CoA dehydrogenase [Pseudomonas sp. CES]KAF4558104.1 SDR family NAD(P)-dependent oxidoreductase [Pseudomonas sp. CES]
MHIEQRHFIVTGGGSGLGEAVVRRLHQLGAYITIFDVNSKVSQKLKDELGGRVEFFCLDICDEVGASSAIDQAILNFGGLRGTVNCAGISVGERVIGKDGPHKIESFERVLKVNLIGTFNILRLSADRMQENVPEGDGERGVIINTASIAAFDGQIGQSAYAASKGGLVSMTLPIARELARSAIRVMTIAPGLFKTPMMETLPEDVQLSLGNLVPFPPRLGYPSEFALLVQHIIENSMLNGETIRLDGAVRLSPR